MSDNPRHTLALITGASSGIGEEFARTLAARGSNLILVARRAEVLQSLADELQAAHGISVEGLVADLSTEEGIAKVVARIEELGAIDLLINNAGFNAPSRFYKSDIERQMDIVMLHVNAPMRLSHAVMAGMVERRKGAVINNASVSAFLPPVIGLSTYHATKLFLITWSEDLQREVGWSGVRVQALVPGFVKTGIFKNREVENARFGENEIPGWLWTTKEQVVRASLGALERKRQRVVVVPGVVYQIIVFLLKRGIVRSLVRFVKL